MPKQFAMSFVRAQKRWTKQYQGRTYSVSCRQLGTGETKDESCLAANDWWAAKEKELLADSKPRMKEILAMPLSEMTKPKQVAEMERYLERNHPEQNKQRMEALQKNFFNMEPQQVAELIKALEWHLEGLPVAMLQSMRDEPIKQTDPTAIDFVKAACDFGTPGTPVIPAWLSEGLGLTPELKPLPVEPVTERAFAVQMQAWLAVLRTAVAAGNLSEGSWERYSRAGEILAKFMGKAATIDEINNACVERLWTFLSGKVAAKEWSGSYCKSIFMSFKQLVKRLGEDGKIVVPGNLMSRRFAFSLQANPVKAFSASEIKDLLAACESERTKLYLLLMLNCGMYQKDVADLSTDEVNWEKGTIKRKRSKHKRRTGKAIPCVTYKLWDCTLELLKKYRTKDRVLNDRGGLCVLATERGKPLVRYWLEDGKSQRYDVINTAWDRLSKVCKLADKPIKLLRKSSASLLASHELHGRLVTYFLGNAPEGISETHYIAEGSKDALLAKALDWLRVQYGL